MQGRILVVDDLPDVRSTVSGILKDAGYFTRSAKSREEALAILAKERFHVAVLDVRLDESDEENQEGMDLLHDIHQHDDSMAVIILTGYANVDIVMKALQPIRGKQPAYRFLRKTEIMSLTEIIPGAFHEALKLNLNLKIDDPEVCIDRLANRIRFQANATPELQEVSEQVREIFCRLFYECESIHLSHVQQGLSGAAVFLVTPVYQGRGQGENVVVKVGDKEEISTEKDNYEKYVKGIVGGHRIPETLSSASTRHISGIQYSFIGLGGQTENFASFYQSATLDDICAVLDNLYLDTLFPLKQKTGRIRSADLREFYLRHLHLNEEKLQKAAARTIGAGLAFTETPDGALLIGTERLINPITFARQADFRLDSFFTTIHGDLNGQNILLGQHHDAWLIDFFTTTDDGHVLQDFAALETNIRFMLAPTYEIDLPLKWTQASFNGCLEETPAPPGIQDYPALLKAHQAIAHIRALAAKTPHYTDRAYLMALFFNALRKTTFSEIPEPTRNHALYCAAKIAEKL